MSQGPKSIVICLDSTVNTSFQESAVARFYSYLLKGDSRQLLLYTDFEDAIEASRALTYFGQRRRFWKPGYKEKIFEIYLFVARNYRDGDKLSFFTSGEGAQVACTVLGMIEKVGILYGSSRNLILCDEAYWAYLDSIGSQSGRRLAPSSSRRYLSADRIKERYAISATVEFFGIWNGEGARACNLLAPSLPVRRFRHALSLHASSPVEMLRPNLQDINKLGYEARDNDSEDEQSELNYDEPEPEQQTTSGADELEVWFEGTNDDGDESSLSRISLRWMINQCKTSNAGILFDERKRREYSSDTGSSATLLVQEITESELLSMASSRLLDISSTELADNLVRVINRVRLRPSPRPSYRPRRNNRPLFRDFVENTRERRNSDGYGGDGSSWMKNTDFVDAISASVLGASRLEEINDQDPLNVHWTVKKRNEVINLLNGPNFTEKGWPVEGTLRWLGDKIDLPTNVKWIV